MGKLLTIIASALGAACGTAASLLFLVLASTLFGGITGWIVGWFFVDTIYLVKEFFNVTSVTDFELGAMLGFFGSFFRG
ncbi:MAG: hypothetical protein JRE23_16205 [Deltaproteobacteria bacterium]|nr:hypothetical protein [Deltaproteobacteria bacterium]